ncbi:hypothetical protein EC973_001422 [Apophysomyces ossiformis]|uniref:Uncharacterized protein n=1 Tax=Apophysomyces ossiformis TaxID=679940 RepID=A0A8H7BQA3_9FUNG|nr:hypothetical protein EC973_001422 [Apophysomyces ossiformis]
MLPEKREQEANCRQLSLDMEQLDRRLLAINVEDELRELSLQQQLNAERLHDMLVETNSQIALVGEMQRDHSSASQSTRASSQAISRRIAGLQDPEISRLLRSFVTQLGAEGWKFEERFDSAHNRSVTEKVERYVLGQPSLVVNLSSLRGKICRLFDNQKQSKNCSAEKKDAMRTKARRQRCRQEKLKTRTKIFNKHRAAVVKEFGEDLGNILAKQLMSEEESKGEESPTLVIQEPSWRSSEANAFYARLDQLAAAERTRNSAVARQKVVVLKELPVPEAFSTIFSSRWRRP